MPRRITAPDPKSTSVSTTPQPSSSPVLSDVRPIFDNMKASPPPSPAKTIAPVRSKRSPSASRPDTQNVKHRKDTETGRRYTVEYLTDPKHGKLARERGRVALSITDLPPALRSLPKLKTNGSGGYQHVYERRLSNVKNLTDSSRTSWFQPMFKQRWTREDEHGTKYHGVNWFSSLGSYWDPAVAAVAAEMGKERHESGQGDDAIRRVEEDLIQAARDFAKGKGNKAKKVNAA